MKHCAALLLIFSLLLSVTGCSLLSGGDPDCVRFYYPCTDYLNREDKQVIVPELREIPGHDDNLDYLLRLYLMGPHDEELVSPFPKGLKVTDIRLGSDSVLLTLTSQLDELQGIPHSLACACIAMTCMDITGLQSVTLMTQNSMLTLDRSSITLLDDSIPQTQ